MEWLRTTWGRFRNFRLVYRVLIVLGVLVAAGGITAGALFLAFPIQMAVYGGMARNALLTIGAPAGTLTANANPAYKAPGYGGLAHAAKAQTTSRAEDWPSYNRTLTSDRFSPLNEINTNNASKLKVLCTYDTGQLTGFETGPIKVGNALIGTTEFDIFSINPDTCAENWRTHEDYPPSEIPVNRGAAYMDGKLFRGTEDGRVLAYDFKTGKRIWETTIADPKHGESVPAAPIAWNGIVFIGNAGGDFKDGKGHMFALDATTGKILWEFFLVPRDPSEKPRGPLGRTALHDDATWKNVSGIPISGGGTWTSYTLDTKTGQLFVPGGNPAPDFAINAREGDNLYTDSIVVLDPKTGNYKHHYKIVREDWHDWDVSNPPVLIETAGGRQLMVDAPKDGYLYGFDRSNNQQVFKTPVTQIANPSLLFSHKEGVRFCPGAVGGEEWNSPVYNPATNLIYTGEVDWCDTVTPQDINKLKSDPPGKPWAGMASWNPVSMFGRFSGSIGHWAGWIYSTDADTGVWKWRLRSNYPIVGGLTATTGGVLFFGDVGGNFYAVDAATGRKIWSTNLGGGIGGGVITYTANGAQRIAVAYGFTHPAWPTKIVTAQVAVLGFPKQSSNSFPAARRTATETTMGLDPLILSRLQFFFTVSWHIIFPAFTIGLAAWLTTLEGIGFTTGNPVYRRLFDFWIKIFAVSFGMGVVTGIVMAFQFGTNWSVLADEAGAIQGPLLGYETFTGFLLEATFLGVMLIGRDRVSPAVYFFACCMVSLGTLISSFWIMVNNSFMQVPVGHQIVDGKIVPSDWITIITSPVFLVRWPHMLLAAFLTTSMCVIATGAWYLLRGVHRAEARAMMHWGMGAAAVLIPVQLFFGHLNGKYVVHYQPSKIAAIEARWQDQKPASEVLLAWPSEERRQNLFAITLPPPFGSLIDSDSRSAGEVGLDSIPRENWPPVAIPFFGFRIMVGMGLLMLAVSWFGNWLRFRGRLETMRWFLWCAFLAFPTGFVAVICGWITAEVGRQPWVVFGLLRTADAVTPTLTGAQALATLLGYIIVYAFIYAFGLSYIYRLLREGPTEAGVRHAPTTGRRPMQAAGTPETATGTTTAAE